MLKHLQYINNVVFIFNTINQHTKHNLNLFKMHLPYALINKKLTYIPVTKKNTFSVFLRHPNNIFKKSYLHCEKFGIQSHISN